MHLKMILIGQVLGLLFTMPVWMHVSYITIPVFDTLLQLQTSIPYQCRALKIKMMALIMGLQLLM